MQQCLRNRSHCLRRYRKGIARGQIQKLAKELDEYYSKKYQNSKEEKEELKDLSLDRLISMREMQTRIERYVAFEKENAELKEKIDLAIDYIEHKKLDKDFLAYVDFNE